MWKGKNGDCSVGGKQTVILSRNRNLPGSGKDWNLEAGQKNAQPGILVSHVFL